MQEPKGRVVPPRVSMGYPGTHGQGCAAMAMEPTASMSAGVNLLALLGVQAHPEEVPKHNRPAAAGG